MNLEKYKVKSTINLVDFSTKEVVEDAKKQFKLATAPTGIELALFSNRIPWESQDLFFHKSTNEWATYHKNVAIQNAIVVDARNIVKEKRQKQNLDMCWISTDIQHIYLGRAPPRA